MSDKHPLIAVTGSSGAGTTSVRKIFEQIFRREKIDAVYVEGDAFHRYDRVEMREKMAEAGKLGNHHFSHFGPEANLFKELEETFASYAATGGGRYRHYIHDEREAALNGGAPGTFTDWRPMPEKSDLLFYEGLHGAIKTGDADVGNQ